MEKLGKYCKIISGYAFKSNDLSEGTEIPVIKIGNISNGNDVIIDSSTQYVSSDFLSIDEKYHIKKGDVLISLTGSHINQPNSMVGRSCRNFSDTEFLLNQRAGKVIPNENADKNYLYYLLNTESFKYSICNRAYGAANQANISPSDIENIKWNFPPLPTQQKIASILSAYDNLIQNYKKQIEALQTAASELYKEWFVRFRFPGYKTTKFENGIPDGWKIEKLGKFVDIKRGGSPRPIQDYISDEGLNWLKISDATAYDYPFIFNIEEHILESGLKKTVLLKSGSLVLSNSATPGLPRILCVDSCIHDGWLYFEKSFFSNEYLYLFFQQERTNIVKLGNGAIFTNLKTDILKEYKCFIPDNKLLKKFQVIIQPYFEKIKKTQQQITNLTQQRDLLLPRLMSGKLEV